MGDYPAASATSAAHVPTEEKQQGRASRNDARCAIIIVFVKEVGLMHFITFNTFFNNGKNLELYLGSLSILKTFMNSLVKMKKKKNFAISVYIWKRNLTNREQIVRYRLTQ